MASADLNSDTPVVRTTASSTRIVHSLETSTWGLRHQRETFPLSEDDAILLAHYFIVDVVARLEGITGSTRIESIDGRLTVHMSGASGPNSIDIDCTAVDTSSAIIFDPEPWDDAWVRTKFKVVIQGATQVKLRAFLPSAADQGAKSYSVLRGQELVASGELARGAESVITIYSDGDAKRWDELVVELEYPEPIPGNDKRPLGFVLVGIDKTPGCAFRTGP